MGETSEAGIDTYSWVEAAMSDLLLAAEVLMQLSAEEPTPKPPLKWGFRQPRSRQTLRSGILQAKDTESSRARASPTTPLSWSGGSSPSACAGAGSADCCEESSRSRKRLAGPSDDVKSKINGDDASPPRSTIRRTKKKTYVELKKELDLLLTEKDNFEKELKRIEDARNKLRETNESLKKLKLNYESQPPKETANIMTDSSAVAQELFDLNLPPAGDEEAAFGSDDIYRTS